MRRAQIVAVVALGLALVAAHAWLHPPARDLVVDGALWPIRLGKIGALLQALATLAAIDLAALAIGSALWRRLSPDGPPSATASLVPRLAIGLLVLAYAVLALAAAHLLVEPALAALVAVPIVAAVPSARRALRTWQPRRPRAHWLVAPLVLVAATPLLDAFVPRYGWDALVYHLGVPERYLHARAIWFTPYSLYSAFPLNAEMLYALGLGLGGGAVAKLINAQFGALALATLWSLGRRVSPRAAWLAVAVVVADPLFAWELGVAYNDLAGAFYALLALGAVVDAGVTLAPRAVARAALFGGACVAIRVPALLVPAVLAALLVVRGRARGAAACARAAAVMALGVALMMAPWLARTAAFTGNPFAPALQLGAHPYFDPLTVEQMLAFSRSVGVGHGLRAVATLPWTLFVAAKPGVYTGGFGFDVGPMYLVALVAALAVADARRQPLVRVALAFAALVGAGWFLTSQEARYLLPALLALALAGGIAFDRRLASAATRAGRALVWTLPLVAVLVTQAPLVASLPSRAAVALGAASVAEVNAADPAARLADRLRATLPPDARLQLLLEPRSFYFRGLDFIPYHVLEGSPTLRLIHDAAGARALRCRFAALGVTHVVVNLDEAHRFHPIWIARYGPSDYAADLARLHQFLVDWSDPIDRVAGVVAARLRPVDGCD